MDFTIGTIYCTHPNEKPSDETFGIRKEVDIVGTMGHDNVNSIANFILQVVVYAMRPNYSVADVELLYICSHY